MNKRIEQLKKSISQGGRPLTPIDKLELKYEHLFLSECWNDCPECWFTLCDRMLSDFESRWPCLQIAQLKEKFGTLRLYASLKEGVEFHDGDSWQSYTEWLAPYEKQARTLYQDYFKQG